MRRFPLLLAIAACPIGLAAQAPPTGLAGRFADDYGSIHQISDSAWVHDGAYRYIVIRWDSAGQVLIARNAPTNPSDGGRFTRIDWMPLEGMPPWRWAFCLATWDAPSADAAARVATADRRVPRTGCGGHPFTRLKPTTVATP